MKKLVCLTAAALALALLLCLSIAKADTALNTNYVSVPESFLTAHPEVSLNTTWRMYKSAGEMTTEMLLGAFDADVFNLDNICVDYHVIMDKGYCLDLSGSEIIREAISNLYPVIARECMVGDKIYALPTRLQLDYRVMNPAVAAETGLGAVEMPDTFPEFLDFAEKWAAYLEEEPDGDIGLMGQSFWAADDTDFARFNGYIGRLVEMLLDNHILQKAYAGEPLRFNEPEVVALLKRCVSVGSALNEVDPAYESKKSFLQIGNGQGIENNGYTFLSLRLNENQPKLLSVVPLELVAVNARTQNPELCVELLEAIAQNNDPTNELLQQQRSLIYQNFELLPSKRHDESVATSQRFLQEAQNALANENLDAIERYELEERLKFREEQLQEAIDREEDKWIVAPDELEIYRSYIDYLYVPMPDVFTPMDAERSKLFTQLKSRFWSGQMTAEQLVTELDRVAEMIEKERSE